LAEQGVELASAVDDEAADAALDMDPVLAAHTPAHETGGRFMESPPGMHAPAMTRSRSIASGSTSSI
jgi:hypothetical protein